jgi:PAS domain S-box-containing protein
MSKKTKIVDINKTDANYLRLQNKIAELEQQVEEYKQLAEKFESVNNKLVESVTRFRLVADYSSDWEMFRDPQNKIIYCSPSIERILGYTPEEYQNLSFADVVHPDDYELAVSAHSRLTQKGESVNPIIFRLIKKSGDFIWVEVFGQTVFTPDGRHIGSRTSTHDIDTIKKIEMELRAKKDELQEAVNVKNKFISILAHDLKNPFNSLIGFSDLLKDEVDNYSNEKLKEFVNNIHDVTIDTYFFLEELLEWARTQQDMVAFNPENIHVIQIVNDCISLLLNASKTKNIEIDYLISKDLYVFADKNMLKTILRNLISNAIKFTPKSGQISILASIKQPYIEIIVSDTGIGMDTNTLESLFKIDKTKSIKGTEGERGTGFGLLLCKEFVEKHGGTICVKSELGIGSDFIITLPIKLD